MFPVPDPAETSVYSRTFHYAGTGREETRNMETVFPPEFFRTENDVFPTVSRYWLAKETSPYSTENASELDRMELERIGIPPYRRQK
jgi:hypothetical protein